MKKTVSVLLAALLAALAFPALAAQTTLNYGGNEISCLVLTDFNDGEVVGAASGRRHYADRGRNPDHERQFGGLC